VTELLQFAEQARRATHACKAAEWHAKGNGVGDAFAEEYLRPGDEQCRFCRAAGSCPALAKKTEHAVALNFEVIEQAQPPEAEQLVKGYDTSRLGVAMRFAPLVEIWLKAVRAETERRMFAGEQIDGFKLVQGKKGPRKWVDPEAAEAQLKSMRLKVEEMYDLKVISPTTAEKLTKAKDDEKPVLGPRQWAKLQSFITQADGKPAVVPVSDKRPALLIAPVADDFAPIAQTPAPAPAVQVEAEPALEALL
jgi:hypothetical protein